MRATTIGAGVILVASCYGTFDHVDPDASYAGAGGTGASGGNGVTAGAGGSAGGAAGTASGAAGNAGGAAGNAGGAAGNAGGAAGAQGSGGTCPASCPGPTTGPGTGSGVCINDACAIACATAYPTICAGSKACVDTTSDSKNCGSCGHDCLGGTCSGSQCQPILIAQYLGNPEIISVGADSVYVTTDLGYVGRAKKDGSDLKPLAMPGLASSAFVGTLVAEDGDRVFLVRTPGSGLQLSYCLTSGCDATATAIGGPYAQYFAVDNVDHQLFWVDYTPSRIMAASSSGTVSGAPIPGGTLASGASGSRLLYAQGGVFFRDGNSVFRLPISGGSIVGVASGASPLTILGANGGFLYVYDGSAIGYVPLPNGTGRAPTPLINASLRPNIDGHFSADDSAAYWVDQGVKSCQLSNCSSSLRSLPLPTSDAVEDVGIDDQAVYSLVGTYDSVNGEGCAVWKLAK